MEDETIHVTYPERVCYVCGRTEEDLKILFNGKKKEIGLRIKTYKNKIREYGGIWREYLLKMLKDTEESNYLELKVETIKTDPSKFGETIPRLDNLLRFNEDDKESLSEIRDRIEKAVENSDDFLIYEAVDPPGGPGFGREPEWKKEFEEFRENRRTVNNMKEEISTLKLVKKKLGLNEYTKKFENLGRRVLPFVKGEDSFYRTDSNDLGRVLPEVSYSDSDKERKEFYDKLRSGRITVYICPICAEMFYEASQALKDYC